ncbi:MAG TPA: FIST N-terminal domain-containing protein [Desulfuromonadaceae bacterium]
MRFRSVGTANSDSYRAGCEIGEALRDLSPEVILLFASISFEDDFADLFAGLYDGVGTTDVVIFGGTGDGIYESSLIAHYGVCALGITSDGLVRWSAAVETGVGANSAAAALRCAESALAQADGPVSWAFVLADGVRADGTGIVAGIGSVVNTPFVGGLAGDDRRFSRSRILFNGREVEDGVAVLLARGDLPFITNAASGWTPFGSAGIVEECRDSSIYRISGRAPMSFIREQIDKPLTDADLGMISLAIYRDEGDTSFSLRSLSRFNDPGDAVTTFGSIEQGAVVRVCGISEKQALLGVSSALEGIRRSGFTPAAAIIVSCVGRKWLLDDAWRQEVELVQKALGSHLPLVGFPSFGEIGPILTAEGTYGENLFHNVSFVICLLGE